MSDLVGNPEDRFSHNEAQIALHCLPRPVSLFTTLLLLLQDSPVPTIHGPHSRAPPMVLPKAQTLAEIENSLIQRPRRSSKPKVLTAEELERQLRGEATQPRNRTPPPMTQFTQNGHPSPGNFAMMQPNMSNTPPRPMVMLNTYLKCLDTQ